jgi:hypothetical protein
VVWLIVWLVLGLAWKGKDVSYRPIVIFAAILTVVGLLFTFPPFFDLFASD